MTRAPFSIKAFLLSLLFVLVAIGGVGLSELAQGQKETMPKTPSLTGFQGGSITINDELALEGQSLFSGDVIGVGEGGEAIVKLHHNQVALDEGTQVKLNQFYANPGLTYAPTPAPLQIELLSGRVWVDAVEGVQIKLPELTLRLDQAVGVVSRYGNEINLSTLQGNMRLAFLDAQGEELNHTFLPVGNEFDLSEGGWNSEYLTLSPFDLQNTFEMDRFDSNSVFQDEWLAKRRAMTARVSNWPEVSPIRYYAEKNVLDLMDLLNFRKNSQEAIDKSKQELIFAYLLGPLNDSGDFQKTNELLAQIQSANPSPQAENYLTLLAELYEATPQTSAFLLKTFLIDELQKAQGPTLFALYLNEVDRQFQVQNQVQADAMVMQWDEAWTDELVQAYPEEYAYQSQQLTYTLLGHMNQVTLDVLDVVNEAGQKRLAYSSDVDKVRYYVTEERLQLTEAMIDRYDYILAEEYLSRSYGDLGIEIENQASKATQLFLSQGTLLAQKIDYAMEALHGAAEPINEAQFKIFVENKQKESALADELRGALTGNPSGLSDTQVALPTPEQARERFLEAGVTLSVVDIASISGAPFEFQVQNAVLDAEKITFGGRYDYATNTISQVQTSDKTYNHSVNLSELEKLFTSSAFVLRPSGPRLPGTSLDSLLTDQERVVAAEDQALAEDLAIKLAITQLEEAGLSISILRSNVQVTNSVVLNEFYVREAQFRDPESNKDWVTVQLHYSTSTQLVTELKTVDGALLIDSVSRENLLPTLEQAIVTYRQHEQLKSDFIRLVRRNDLEVEEGNVTVQENGTLKIVELKLSTLPLSISGVYDPEAEQFITAFHPLYTGKKMALEAYFEELADRFIVNHLALNGIEIKADQITAKYPFKLIQLKEVDINGVHFDFNLDVERMQPANVRVVETSVSLGNISFEMLKEYAGL